MRKKLVVVFLAVVLLLVPALVAVAAVQAQETPTPGGCEHPSTSIALSASPTEIPADDVSTSEIKVVVSLPGENDITGPVVNDTLVDLFTTRGRLTDAENQSNSGSSISLITDNNGAVTALLSGNETGVAYVTSVTLLGTCNKTTVTFVAPGATPTSAPSGDGNGAVTTPTPAPTAAVNVTPSPSPEATATPAVSVTPTVTTSPSPTEAPTPTATATATPEKRWQIPGFEAVFAIASLLSVAYLVMRRRKAQS